MLEWKRTKYLAHGCYIQEVAKIGKQCIVIEWLIRNSKTESRARYYHDDTLIKVFDIKATDIEDLKTKAYGATINFINEQIADWSGMLYDFWKAECWEDDIDD